MEKNDIINSMKTMSSDELRELILHANNQIDLRRPIYPTKKQAEKLLKSKNRNKYYESLKELNARIPSAYNTSITIKLNSIHIDSDGQLDIDYDVKCDDNDIDQYMDDFINRLYVEEIVANYFPDIDKIAAKVIRYQTNYKDEVEKVYPGSVDCLIEEIDRDLKGIIEIKDE